MKKLIVIISIIMLTGCDATYRLKIDENTINEYTTIEEKNINNLTKYCEKNTTDSDSYDDCLNKYKYFSDNDLFIYFTDNIRDDGLIENKEIYTTRHDISDKNKMLSYEHIYNMDDYTKSTILNYCFEDLKIDKTDDGATKISANGKITCGNEMLQSIKLEISSDDYNIINDNADKKKSGKYIWNINLKGDNDIHFELKEKVNYTPYIVVGSIILIAVLFLGFVVARNLSRINNEV